MSRPTPEPTVAQLHEALKYNQFRLHYQPIIALDDQRLEAAEALLRWEHPRYGLLKPDAFLALAETSGLIRDIGDWALRHACWQAADWRQRGLPAFTIAVNVSAAQARDDFAAKVLHALNSVHLPADSLELELTESVAFGDPALFATFETLHRLGVRFAADDFGTGYSCLRQLKCCPIGTLKIDQSFVARLPADARDAAIVEAVTRLGHGLGMRVVAEGVETAGALEALRALGVDAAQGYLFSRPLPADRFADYLHQTEGYIAMNTNESAAGCISCCQCCREIPLDAALTADGAEYVEYFCGLECYQQFLMLAAEQERNPSARAEPSPRSTGLASNGKLKPGE